MEWLGLVPEGWEVKRLRFLVATNPSKTEVRLSSDDFVSFVPMEAVGEYGGMQCQERCLDEIGSGYTYFADGDILIAKITPCFENVKGAIAENLTNGIGFGSTEFHVVRHLGTMSATYCFWVSISYIFRKVGEAHMYGAGGQKRIPDVFIKNFHLPTPPLPEQHAIAAFLDQQCAQIDSLIEKKQRMLNLLDEKRRAVITQAVTRGLDPTLPMKDSGVEWLGIVPKRWEVKPLKTAIMFQRGHDLPADHRDDGAYPLVSSSGISGVHSVAVAKGPGIVTGRYGTLGVFYFIDSDYWPLNTTLYSIDIYKNVPKFLYYMLSTLTSLIKLYSIKSAVPGIDRNDLHPTKVVLPPLPEQQAIADYLDAQCAAMDSQRENLEKSIELLREYRASLITHAVTGKIDVRDVAPLQ